MFTGLASGNYTVTIQDAKGFEASVNVTIGNNCLQLAFSVVNTTCSRSNGSITATGANGTSPYSYSLDGTNFQLSPVFAGLPAGAYTVTLQDATGLETTAGITLTDALAPLISLDR